MTDTTATRSSTIIGEPEVVEDAFPTAGSDTALTSAQIVADPA